ncbi:bacterioferritin-associated ferredoxin [Agarivorans aestuarii]|uniref:Bacterioferritin-associated ferredoxin n=1 Tax=Agarivorans aestuarii TaxID=1563703 RepID=A0ABU7G3M7_9ALTE|nr:MULTISPECIES: bacterioferritin-associated ferredoxin [Agarivorans]MEE1673090.1 bacterioferritin-associated ferredoxin [Agarivorans aestuarii]
MFVCLCHGITDKQIKEAVQQGCENLADVRKKNGVASECGKCARMAKTIINKELSITPKYYEVA